MRAVGIDLSMHVLLEVECEKERMVKEFGGRQVGSMWVVDRRVKKEIGKEIQGAIGVVAVIGREAMRGVARIVEGMKGKGMERGFGLVEDIEMYPGGTAWVLRGEIGGKKKEEQRDVKEAIREIVRIGN